MIKKLFAFVLLSCLASLAQVTVHSCTAAAGGGVTTIFSDTFESGDFTNWTAQSATAVPTVQSTTKFAGTYAAEMIADTQQNWIRKDIGTYGVGTTLYGRAYIYNSDRGSGTRYDFPVISFGRSADMAGATSIMWGNSTNTRRFHVRDEANTTGYPGTVDMAWNTWYRVELKVVVGDGTAGSFEARLYDSGGTLLDTITQTGIDTWSVNLTSFKFGHNGANRSYALRVDNPAVSTEGWIGQ